MSCEVIKTYYTNTDILHEEYFTVNDVKQGLYKSYYSDLKQT